jgi:hypothetical protein
MMIVASLYAPGGVGMKEIVPILSIHHVISKTYKQQKGAACSCPFHVRVNGGMDICTFSPHPSIAGVWCPASPAPILCILHLWVHETQNCHNNGNGRGCHITTTSFLSFEIMGLGVRAIKLIVDVYYQYKIKTSQEEQLKATPSAKMCIPKLYFPDHHTPALLGCGDPNLGTVQALSTHSNSIG